MRTGGCIPAFRPDKGRQDPLVEFNNYNNGKGQKFKYCFHFEWLFLITQGPFPLFYAAH